MASLSQALRLGDLPPPHRTFQGHATHIIEWSMMLRPNDSWRVGRIRARYLTARLPNPPVRPVRETFASYGSRERDIYRKLPFRQLHGIHRGQLARSLATFVPFPHPLPKGLRHVRGFPALRLLCP